MACTLQSVRIGRTFDCDYPGNEKALSDDRSLSMIAVVEQVEELKVPPEAACPKSVMLAYKLYKYRDKLMSLIDGSRGQYRVCIIPFLFHYKNTYRSMTICFANFLIIRFFSL